MIDNDTLAAMTSAPTEHFDSPLAVTRDDRLSHAQKEAVLQAWSEACRRDQGSGGQVTAGLDHAYLKEVEHAIDRLAELRRS